MCLPSSEHLRAKLTQMVLIFLNSICREWHSGKWVSYKKRNFEWKLELSRSLFIGSFWNLLWLGRSVTILGCFWMVLGRNVLTKVSPISLSRFGLFQNTSLFMQKLLCLLFGTLLKNWATFNSTIWTHWSDGAIKFERDLIESRKLLNKNRRIHLGQGKDNT